jgi:hypothetical protein
MVDGRFQHCEKEFCGASCIDAHLSGMQSALKVSNALLLLVDEHPKCRILQSNRSLHMTNLIYIDGMNIPTVLAHQQLQNAILVPWQCPPSLLPQGLHSKPEVCHSCTTTHLAVRWKDVVNRLPPVTESYK